MARSSIETSPVDNGAVDIAIAGGGLAGGLIALALAIRRPDKRVALIEAGDRIGGERRWSWFASDLGAAESALVEGIEQARWEAGYEVAFPSHSRLLATPYRSMQSRDFAWALSRRLAAGTILTRTPVALLEAGAVTLADGGRIEARAVLDCRGLAGSRHLTGGWQVFMGRRVRLDWPHQVERPVIMDACVEQLGGYRFVYVLPLGPREIFLEDTYYQDTPVLDRALLSQRLDAYAQGRGWKGEVVEEETGVLPVVSGGDFAAFQAESRVPGVAVAGARGGFVHPLTSYTLPFAAGIALQVAARADLPGERLAALLEQRAREHWADTRFYRQLGAMLFDAARPEERRAVFERFYRLSPGLIERFYAGRSTLADRLRVLVGRPPVPIPRALRALVRRQGPLVQQGAEAQGS